jgi:Nucleotidyl transferase AbiEii toxin, Type IV TA system
MEEKLRELLRQVGEGKFLLIGAHALEYYGVVRQTLDVDLLIAASSEREITAALLGFGYSRAGRSRVVARYQSSEPRSPDVDVLPVDAGTFARLLDDSRDSGGGIRVPSLPHMFALKAHAIRNDPRREPRDLADMIELWRANNETISVGELEEICNKFGPRSLFQKISVHR